MALLNPVKTARLQVINSGVGAISSDPKIRYSLEILVISTEKRVRAKALPLCQQLL